MAHPRRAITRELRTRRPKRPGRERDEIEAQTWPERAVRVKEVMTRPAVTIGWEATAGQSWKLMRDRKVRHLPPCSTATGAWSASSATATSGK